ncbi:MAG: nicotinate phosphoribosyltransferase, partial [Alphaproteobacteria bacterium]
MPADGDAAAGRNAPASPPEPEVARLADKYFLKTKAAVGRFGDKQVTYAVFMRRPVICTPKLAVGWLEDMARARGVRFDIRLTHAEGEWVGAGEPLMMLTGPLYHLVDLETIYLQKLGPACVAAYNAYQMCVDLPQVA